MAELAMTSQRKLGNGFVRMFSVTEQRRELDKFKRFLETDATGNSFVLTDSCRNTVSELKSQLLTKKTASRLIRAESILRFSINARYAAGALVGYVFLIPAALVFTLKDLPKTNIVALSIAIPVVWALGGLLSINRYFRALQDFVDSLKELAPKLEATHQRSET